ncbi:MAG: prepilin-type N-terminal cleavage/methylation domain-containing protein [Planctomycetota bacterium]
MPLQRHRQLRDHGGFTFIEVMFAVLIMGAGVAMIAAMLPTAVRQTRDLRDQAAGQAAIESGFQTVQTLVLNELQVDASTAALSPPLPDYGAARVWSLPSIEIPSLGLLADSPSVFLRTLNDRVVADRPVDLDGDGAFDTTAGSYAWIPFFQREGSAAQLAMVAIAARGDTTLTTWHFSGPDIAGGALHFWNGPLPVEIQLLEGSKFVAGEGMVEDVPDQIALAVPSNPAFAPPNGVSLSDYDVALAQAAVEGAAIVVFGPTEATTPAGAPFFVNTVGTTVAAQPQIRIYRLGQRPDPAGTPLIFELDATGDMSAFVNADNAPVVEEMDGAQAYLIGRGLENPLAPFDVDDNPFIGRSQVVATLPGVRIEVE